MIKETKKAPTIRFRGFTDDWERRKLGQFFFTATEKNDDGEYSQADILAASLGTELEKKHIFFGLRSTAESVKKYRKVQLGDIVYTKSPIKHYPNGIFRTCKKIPGIVPSMYCVYHKRGNIKINTSIVQCFFENKYRLDNYLRPLVNVGARNNVNITDEEVLKGTITIPINIEEQTQIVDLIENLNSLITLHQCKLDQLKTLKKYFLQNMFPAKGEKVPRIRFKGFTGDWEQRKVGEFYDFKNGLNKNKEFFGTGVPIVNFTDVFHNRGLTASQLEGRVTLEPNEIKNYRVKKGDIFFTRTSETIEEIGYPSVMLDTPENTVFSGFVLRGRCFSGNDPLDNLFKQYVFFTQSFRDEMKKKSSMTTRALTSGTSIKEMLFQFPSSKNEQHQIGKCITKFDDLITLHQRKLNQLQTMKKFMLQNLFI